MALHKEKNRSQLKGKNLEKNEENDDQRKTTESVEEGIQTEEIAKEKVISEEDNIEKGVTKMVKIMSNFYSKRLLTYLK